MTKCPKCNSEKVRLEELTAGCIMGTCFAHYECLDCGNYFSESNIKPIKGGKKWNYLDWKKKNGYF